MKIPRPLLTTDKPVDWWFIFKFNAAEEHGQPKPEGITGLFDIPSWTRPKYENNEKNIVN